uniref:Uncharacterized protein n=1 Tax=Physcomitrium patens TaxID=3218 RepID=A0A2K1JZY0_PHYPA|nr:hypothetical protein PHYPA_014203 [Physcomitrium patens]
MGHFNSLQDLFSQLSLSITSRIMGQGKIPVSHSIPDGRPACVATPSPWHFVYYNLEFSFSRSRFGRTRFSAKYHIYWVPILSRRRRRRSSSSTFIQRSTLLNASQRIVSFWFGF